MTHGPSILEGKGIAHQIDALLPPTHMLPLHMQVHARSKSLSVRWRISCILLGAVQYLLESKGTMQKSY
jgi:hypothetical protein